MDLSLVPIEELVEEISSRCRSYVIAYEIVDKGDSYVFVDWDDNQEFLITLGLTQYLAHEVIQSVEDE